MSPGQYNMYYKIGFIMCTIGILINLIGFMILETDESFSMEQLLDKFEEAPTIKLSLKTSIDFFTIKDEWVVMDEFRVFLNHFSRVFGFVIWAISLFIDMAIFLIYAMYVLGFTPFYSYA